MADIPIEKRFAVLCEITRAQHFAWREAVSELCPSIDAGRVVDRMWELTGVETARAYAARFDASKPVAPQFAAGIAWSSACMGEDAVAEPGEREGEAFVRHRACPWLRFHDRKSLREECLRGCDAWFGATVAELNRALGTKLEFETLEAMPSGDASCLRRLWVIQP